MRLDVNSDPVAAAGESHAPVPFFATNKGYGIYFDTARYAEFYCGKQKNNGQNTAASAGGVAGNVAELYAVRLETNQIMSVRIPAVHGTAVYMKNSTFDGGSCAITAANFEKDVFNSFY